MMASSVTSAAAPPPGVEPENVAAAAGGSGEWLAAFTLVVGDESVAIDPTHSSKHKAEIKQLADLGRALNGAANFEQWNAHARTKLRVYRTEVEERVAQLRKDLDSMGNALQEALQSISQNGEDQSKQLESELSQLGRLRKLEQIEEIHCGLDAVSHRLSDLVKNIQAQNSMVVAQMRDEIRTLQQRLEVAERRERSTPGNLSHRGVFERKIQAKIGAGEIFALFLVRITNWKETIKGLNQDGAQTLTNRISLRLGKVLGAETFAGRWYEGYFAAIVTASKRQAIGATQEIVQGVSGSYDLGAGIPPVRVTTRVAVVEHYEGQSAEHMLRRVDELIRAFEGS
jgi:GGDEF domain-containing protein